MAPLLSVLLMAAPVAARAEPFSVANDPCMRWVTQMRLGGVVRQRFTSWLEGVLVGFDAAGNHPPPSQEDVIKARQWMDDYCASRPDATVREAAAAMMRR